MTVDPVDNELTSETVSQNVSCLKETDIVRHIVIQFTVIDTDWIEVGIVTVNITNLIAVTVYYPPKYAYILMALES